MRVHQAVGVEINEVSYQRSEGGVRRGVNAGADEAEAVWRLMCPQRQPRYDTETAAASALEGPEQIGMQALAMRTIPSAVTTSASNRDAAAVP